LETVNGLPASRALWSMRRRRSPLGLCVTYRELMGAALI
jgi:hypothetical protein